MSFQSIDKVEDYQFYLDYALRKGREAGEVLRLKKLSGGRSSKSKQIEIAKMKAVSDAVALKMHQIVKSFPDFDSLAEFYVELISIFFEIGEIRRALATIKWVGGKNRDLLRVSIQKVMKTVEFSSINLVRKAYIGRMSSLLKQAKTQLKFLEEVRRVLKEFPVIKTGMPTVAICGFPNVGKTTLLKRLTGSNAAVGVYPFTTKSLNLSYIKEEQKKVQLIDTPGALDRFDKLNDIEKVAYLAIKHCAKFLIFVFDLTGEYPLEKQEGFFKRLKTEYKLPILKYVSKTDIIKEETYKEFLKKHPNAINDKEKLKEEILKQV